MKTTTFRSGILCSFVLFGALAACTVPVTTGSTSGQQGPGGQQGQGQGAPAGLATALGVSDATLQSCMPAPQQGTQSATQPAQPDMSSAITCLQGQSSLSSSEIQTILAQYAPRRPSN